MRFVIVAFFTLPLLPVMYLQARRIRATVPKLPEAEQPQGVLQQGADHTLNLLILGESTMAGVGVKTHDEGFAGFLAKGLAARIPANLQWQVFAQSGYTVQAVRQAIVPQLPPRTDIIVIGLGANDAFTLNTPGRWRKHIRLLIRDLRATFKNTPIVFTNMPPIKEFPAMTRLLKLTIGNLVEALGRALDEEVQAHANVYYHARTITVKDWIERFQLNKPIGDFFSDGIHPSQLTYRIWAQDLAEFIVARPHITEHRD